MGLIEEFKGLRYRVRVFDHYHHLATVEVPARGQDYITLTVKKKLFGVFGEETKLAFKINDDIPPFHFGGYVLELNFDVMDGVPLSDLLDIAPDLVYDINKNYREIQSEREAVRKDIVARGLDALTDPETPPEKPGDNANPAKEEEKEKKSQNNPVKKIRDGISTTTKLLDTLHHLKDAEDPEREKHISDTLEICQKYPKLLYWLPKHLGIDTEVHALVSQMRIKRVGIRPSYYLAQANAPISEKTLTRPAIKEGWQQVAIFAIIVMGVLGAIGILAWIFTHA